MRMQRLECYAIAPQIENKARLLLDPNGENRNYQTKAIAFCLKLDRPDRVAADKNRE